MRADAVAAWILVVSIPAIVGLAWVLWRSNQQRSHERAIREVGGRACLVMAERRVRLVGSIQARAPSLRARRGSLALGLDRLVYRPSAVAERIAVPLAAVTAVAVTRSYNGNPQGRTILCVEWRNDGEEQSAGWMVDDSAAWLTALGRHSDHDPGR